MRFTLWDAATAGVQLATYTPPAQVALTDGVFAVEIDFGAQFTGEARWVQAEAKCADDVAYTNLPRVALTATPYAIGLVPGSQTIGSLSGTGGIIRATNTGQGAALVGLATSGTGTTYGVLGNAFSPNGYAVWGYASGGATAVQGVSTGTGNGVNGSTSAGKAGVYGLNTNPVNYSVGVLGVSDTAGTYGVYGSSVNGTGVGGKGALGPGVVGASDSNIGVWGDSLTSDAIRGNAHAANKVGVVGQNDAGIGVWGETAAEHTFDLAGVAGVSRGDGGIGVKGTANTGLTSYGMYGVSQWGTGVVGQSTEGTGMRATAPVGLIATATANGGVAIVGRVAAGLTNTSAGQFEGDVLVTGNLFKGGGAFKIDHPLDPANKYLYHSFVESPDMLDIYTGNVTTDANGEAVVQLPDWFEALNTDFRYQLTPIGQFAQAIVWRKIVNHQFTIKTDRPKVEVSWQVTGTRQDPFAKAYRIPVEENKPVGERGKYLHPELYDQSPDKSSLSH